MNESERTTTIKIEPKPKPRMTYQGKFSDRVQNYLKYQEALAWLLKINYSGKFNPSKNIRLSASFHCKKRRGRNPDLSNLVKGLEDALQHSGIIKDDVQIVQFGSMARIYPSDHPRIEVTIEVLE